VELLLTIPPFGKTTGGRFDIKKEQIADYQLHQSHPWGWDVHLLFQ